MIFMSVGSSVKTCFSKHPPACNLLKWLNLSTYETANYVMTLLKDFRIKIDSIAGIRTTVKQDSRSEQSYSFTL